MSEFARSSWNALTPEIASPLISWDWLNHLEKSGSICPETGWQPLHLGAFSGTSLVAAAPAYLHGASWGEFVFDFAWADVAEQLGKRYYPKLVGASPATPSTAYSFLLPQKSDRAAWYSAFLDQFKKFASANDIPVIQFNFVAPSDVGMFEEAGFHIWRHHAFEWRNAAFSSFEQYLSLFRKGPRRNIVREVASMDTHMIRLEMIRGDAAPDSYWPHLGELYHRTNDQFGPYAARFLTSEFFTQMPEAIKTAMWFSAAHSGDREDPVALALLLRGADRVYGRYWGTYQEVNDLHFNVCYYQPIRWAIQEGIPLFDPGMGSPHKVRRGFSSVPAFSAHLFLDDEMQELFAANIDRINAYEDAQISELNAAVPFRREPPLSRRGRAAIVPP